MIIWGTKPLHSRIDSGKFYCPHCREQQPFARKRVRRFFTLYFIPVIPLADLGEYVECEHCSNQYLPDVLSYDPEDNTGLFKAQVEKVIEQVLLMLVAADGEVHPAELAAVQGMYGELGFSPITEANLRELAAHPPTAPEVLRGVTELGDRLNDDGKELVLKAAIMVAAADKRFDQAEYEAISKIAGALRVSEAHLHGILDLMFGPKTTAAAA